MIFLFDNADNINKLREFCKQWKGTPFRHFAGQAGIGCDCIHFIVRGLEYFGFEGINIPWYAKDFHLHSHDEILLNGIRKTIPGIELTPDNPKNGDLILYKFGHVMSHVGWFLDGRVWQAIVRARLNSRTWKDEYWYSRRQLIYRIAYNV